SRRRRGTREAKSRLDPVPLEQCPFADAEYVLGNRLIVVGCRERAQEHMLPLRLRPQGLSNSTLPC
ncbi:MAG: hypothetical protein ACKVK6_15450, partial [bacterium]